MPDRWRTPLGLGDWDYTQPAIYHITICIADRTNRLGTPSGSIIQLTEAGEMVETQLLSLPDRFLPVGIDSYVIMPNHIHFIIEMNLEDLNMIGTDLSQPESMAREFTIKAGHRTEESFGKSDTSKPSSGMSGGWNATEDIWRTTRPTGGAIRRLCTEPTGSGGVGPRHNQPVAEESGRGTINR